MEQVQDPLKPLEKILEPDEREAYLSGTLEDVHRVLSTITLQDNVPVDVRQLFETAKNICLYSYFVYRFHQVSELVAYSAMEMALRIRYERENPESKPKMLSKLLKHAESQGWLQEERFSYRQEIAYQNAEMKNLFKIIESGALAAGEEIPLEAPTDADIKASLNELDLISGIVNSAAKLRNSLAHGSNTLHPESLTTLRITAEVINQVFHCNQKKTPSN